ncbi:Aste57867_2430 [Aphanomyces stellatus]|uniref:Aste57867_2430 protein n=1 Tax=Aphanomyces stellatus TaxID=120398 RepID=A0A485K902_9STRA|nr:hypothetical protein As57867_002424 [Aphanomyces stellatus]VFT79631.1 Aste57867_2430 [Aphanomyces stellatus]
MTDLDMSTSGRPQMCEDRKMVFAQSRLWSLALLLIAVLKHRPLLKTRRRIHFETATEETKTSRDVADAKAVQNAKACARAQRLLGGDRDGQRPARVHDDFVYAWTRPGMSTDHIAGDLLGAAQVCHLPAFGRRQLELKCVKTLHSIDHVSLDPALGVLTTSFAAKAPRSFDESVYELELV